MLFTFMNDKQFIVGFSFGLACSVPLALWRRSAFCHNTPEKCVTREKKKKKKNTEFKMVIVVRKDAKITKRELAVQCACACVEAFKKSQAVHPDYVQKWQRWGQMKIAVKVNTEAELLSVKAEADNHQLINYLARDADPSKNNALVLAIGPDSVDDINEVTGNLKLL